MPPVMMPPVVVPAVMPPGCHAGDQAAGRGAGDDAASSTATRGADRHSDDVLSPRSRRHSAPARPITVAPVVAVMLVSARMLPMNAVLVPRVAELPTCQKTLHVAAAVDHAHRRVARRGQRAADLEDEDRVRVAPASSMSVPVSCADDEKQ